MNLKIIFAPLLLATILDYTTTYAMQKIEQTDDCPEVSHLKDLIEYPITINHKTADFFECDIPDTEEFLPFLETYMREAASIAGATSFEYSIHKFQPDGFSAFLILGESHISIHYWWEERFAAIDIMTCGVDCKPNRAISYLATKFNPKDISTQSIKRP